MSISGQGQFLAIGTDTNNYWKAGKGIRGHKHSKPKVAVPFDFFFSFNSCMGICTQAQGYGLYLGNSWK